MDKTELTAVEVTALDYRKNLGKGVKGTPIPYSLPLADMICEYMIDECPEECKEMLINLHDELAFMELHLLKLEQEFLNKYPSLNHVDDETVVRMSLKRAAIDGINQFLEFIRMRAESRLMDIQNGIDRTKGGFNGKLN